jgi:nicotinamidase-related amidase
MPQVGSVYTAPDPTEVARRPLEANKSALVVVDIQEKLVPPIFEKERLVRNSQVLLRLARILDMPVLATTQYTKGLGAIVPEIASQMPPGEVVDKTAFSCFGSERFCSAVHALPGNRNTLVVCGMETHICVLQTVLGALNQGFLVHVASDAVSSRAEWNWKIGLRRMEVAGALISSTETIIYELLRSSDTPAFKEMLQHLK